MKKNRILFASAAASVNFALACLEPYGSHLRLRSSFVNPGGEAMHWHEFGDLDGPGWAVNMVGGADLLYHWGGYVEDAAIQDKALGLLDHILEDGFIDWQSGLIYPYFDLAQGRFCWNYSHNDDWLCPGSLARIGGQLLEFAGLLESQEDESNQRRVAIARGAAMRLGEWLAKHLTRLPNGWLPRRITPQGEAYPGAPGRNYDPIFDCSADGLYVLQLWAELSRMGEKGFRTRAIELGKAFIEAGGWFGSINHDTYDEHESVAYATAFRVLRQAAKSLELEVEEAQGWTDFAYEKALNGLEQFRMDEDRHGVPTRGLLWMEKSWNTAYLWENAEAALAYLEAWQERKNPAHLQTGKDILEAIARHHHGKLGFLTEGVDWDNHVGRRHHVHGVLYGDIAYTEPLLNNLHLLAPTLFYFQKCNEAPVDKTSNQEAIGLVAGLRKRALPEPPGANGVRYLLRFYFPALETDERLHQALDFTRRSGADGVLLFEASYDMDPALLTLETLDKRFERLKAIVPRFRPIVKEVHINVMITLGHVDAGSGRPERFPFQFMIDEYGNPSRSTACPLDPAFLKHVSALYRLAARCGADAIWVDDDTRYLIHDLPGMTCFCPLHLQAMQRYSGRTWQRAELVEALRNAPASQPGNHAPGLRDLWFDLQEESMLRLARTIEHAVHSVDPHQAIGLMSVGQSLHAAEGRHTDRLLRVLAGERKGVTHAPLIRPGSGFWSDERPLGVFDKATGCWRELSFLGHDTRAVAEIENHPYSPFGKSERVLGLELALDVLNGMPDLSLNLLSSMGGEGSGDVIIPLEPEGTDYATFLKKQRPFLDALAKEWSGKIRLGIDISDHEDIARHTALDGKALVNWIQPRPWEQLLARLGFPLGGAQAKPHWICGEVIHAIPEYELRWFLREGAVLDPIAAQGLIQRGWGERLGLKAIRCVNDAVNELLTNDPINAQYHGHILPVYNHVPPEQLYSYELTGGRGRILSEWLNVDGEWCGPASVILEADEQLYSAALPWRVALLPYALTSAPLVMLNLARRTAWANLLEYVGGRPLPCRIVKGVNLYPMAFQSVDESSWLLAVANLGADEARGAILAVDGCRNNPGDRQGKWRVEILGKDGKWLPGGKPVEEKITVDVDAFSLAVVRF